MIGFKYVASIENIKLVENNDYSEKVFATSSKHLCTDVLTKDDDGDINMHMLGKSGWLEPIFHILLVKWTNVMYKYVKYLQIYDLLLKIMRV